MSIRRVPDSPAQLGRRVRLLSVFRRLNAAEQAMLIAHAQRMLAGKRPSPSARILPKAGESVVHAIRRLTRAYPDLERAALMSKVASLLAAHSLDGRSAADVIGELEALFAATAAQLSRTKRGSQRLASR